MPVGIRAFEGAEKRALALLSLHEKDFFVLSGRIGRGRDGFLFQQDERSLLYPVAKALAILSVFVVFK